MADKVSKRRAEEQAGVRQLIDARLGGVIFSYLGDVDVRVVKQGNASNASDVRAAYSAYGALLDRRLTTQTLALAMCSGGKVPATTVDKLSWTELHLRSYTDEEL